MANRIAELFKLRIENGVTGDCADRAADREIDIAFGIVALAEPGSGACELPVEPVACEKLSIKPESDASRCARIAAGQPLPQGMGIPALDLDSPARIAGLLDPIGAPSIPFFQRGRRVFLAGISKVEGEAGDELAHLRMLDQRLVKRLAERTQHRVDVPVELDLPADLRAVGQRLETFYAGIAAASLAVEPHPVRRFLVRGELAAQLFECIGLVAVQADLSKINIGQGHAGS
ncbi:hypothetical protein [Sinorhizobium fredii]|uniref:hypothetical protein n=1 Tax=Rhizobium fredii TaxID=380 RepID=UPI00351477C4